MIRTLEALVLSHTTSFRLHCNTIGIQQSDPSLSSFLHRLQLVHSLSTAHSQPNAGQLRMIDRLELPTNTLSAQKRAAASSFSTLRRASSAPSKTTMPHEPLTTSPRNSPARTARACATARTRVGSMRWGCRSAEEDVMRLVWRDTHGYSGRRRLQRRYALDGKCKPRMRWIKPELRTSWI